MLLETISCYPRDCQLAAESRLRIPAPGGNSSRRCCRCCDHRRSLPEAEWDGRTVPNDRGQKARHFGDGDFAVDQLLFDFGAHSSCDDFVLVFVVPDVDTQAKYGRKYADGANVIIGNETQTLRVGTLVIDTSRVKILEVSTLWKTSLTFRS